MSNRETKKAPKSLGVGDVVGFYHAKFRGAKIRQLFDGMESLTGTIVAVKLHRTKARQVFTIQIKNREDIKVYGRKLYYNLFHHSPKTDLTTN
jgi:hypothetical protein